MLESCCDLFYGFNMTNFEQMLEGYRRFRAGGWKQQRERWSVLAEGQSPRMMVIACSDSRVDPATIFDTSPGEMFVVRNVANLVPPYEIGGGRHGVSAALEFAVTQLEVEEVIVLGHGSCGGVAAALSRKFEHAKPGEGGFIAHWIDLLDDARDRVMASHGPEAATELEHETVKVSLQNLRSFPYVEEREKKGTLKLRGGWFAISDGQFHLLDEASGKFSAA